MRHRTGASITLGLVMAGILALSQAWAVSPPPVSADHGMVVSAQRLASQIGADVLQQGGNAIDAAVAVGYALAVVHPCCGNIGGGGFMLVHLATGEDVFINFRETAPGAATADMYLDADGNVASGVSTGTWLGVGVPGTVMGFETAREKYGTMSREALMAPAIALARDGYVLHQGDVDILGSLSKTIAADPAVAAIFSKDGQPYQAGDTLVQSQLADTLQLISDGGTDAFYTGSIADAIVAASDADGGIFTKQDFADYTAEVTEPVSCDYRGYTVLSSPPPSSGGTIICEILNIVEGYPMGFLGFHSASSVHFLTEAMRHAYVDRNSTLGDPAFIDNPLDRLLSKDYAAEIRDQIKSNRATPSSEIAPGTSPHEGNDTTHYSVVDADGNAVAVTYTINFYFGVKKIAGDTGFFLNNELDDFTSKPGVPNAYGLVQGDANAVAAGKRPLSSMSPTIVSKDGKVFMVTGSPGGSRIITITLESIMNVVDHGMDIQEAVDAPRIHHQWLPDVVYAEPYALSNDTISTLESMGYTIDVGGSWGATEAILVDPETGTLYGANDNRRPAGAAIGY